MPGGKTLRISFPFDVVPTPENENDALQAYIATIDYAGEDLKQEENTYSAENANSFENFLIKYPESIYADHVYVNMMNFYKITLLLESRSITQYLEKSPEFLLFYPHLKNELVKINYLNSIHSIILRAMPEMYDEKVDEFLKMMEKDRPILSRDFIKTAKGNSKNKNIEFTNYAQQRVDNKNKR